MWFKCGSKMVKFGQIWKWSYSKHVYEIPYAVCETAWEPSESPYGQDLDRVNYDDHVTIAVRSISWFFDKQKFARFKFKIQLNFFFWKFQPFFDFNSFSLTTLGLNLRKLFRMNIYGTCYDRKWNGTKMIFSVVRFGRV